MQPVPAIMHSRGLSAVPNNVGGRTRAIMVDPNDPTHHKIWAGSIAGGLWFVNDIDSLTGISTPALAQQNYFKVYPNPFNSIVHFVFNTTANSDNTILRIFDVTGKIVQQINCGQQTRLDWQPAQNVVHGLYFAELISGNNKYVQKIVYLK